MPSQDAINDATTRRLRLLRAIVDSVRERQRPPANSELAAQFGVSRRTVQTDEILLQRAGYLEIDPGVVRGVRVTAAGMAVVGAVS